jgi:short-subunit dehydrogenase
MELGLSGRTAVITGGSKGIGRAIARGLAKEGVKLVLIARNAEALEKTAEDIRKESGVSVVAATADITSTEQVDAGGEDREGCVRHRSHRGEQRGRSDAAHGPSDSLAGR